MESRKRRLFGLTLALGLGLGLIVLTLLGGQVQADSSLRAAAAPPESSPPPLLELAETTLSGGAPARLPARFPAGPGDVIEVFTNTWSYSTIGLVYDPSRETVRYAHESQSSLHHPTIFEVDLPAPHPVLISFSLSAVNSGWPWQIDNRTGAGYDFVQDTYFLPDYNGDLSYADDNIVEIDPLGYILNAWEMDDEVGSNDSSDGSEIDNIIDIAVVPGSPNRYFATAAYDGAIVYEIFLQRTGTRWTPNSWHTVMTYTLSPALGDNLGIDFDAQNEVLYHSSWNTTTILITDLEMNPITGVPATFDCPGAGGYNSGVTFIEGSSPPEVWVTDFTSDKTTRCESPLGQPALAPGWEKRVEGQLWTPGLLIETQTYQIIQVTDVITALEPLTLTESWNPARLTLLGWDILPPVGTVITTPGTLTYFGPAGPPERVIIEKWFRVEPCDWATTFLEEALVIDGVPPFEIRDVTIAKLPPELQISSAYQPEVFAGSLVSFTLNYSNTGGFENDVWIMNTFPVSAPFAFAEPYPDQVGPGGLTTRWNIDGLALGETGRIDVFVLISETVPPSSTITIWDGIFNHVDLLQDETWIEFHANQEVFPIFWEKFVNGTPWHPGISLTLQTSQTMMVEEFIDPMGNPSGFTLIEEWNPDELALLPGWTVLPPDYIPFAYTPFPGLWVLEVPPGFFFGPLNIIKEFHVEPCTWPETILWESLGVGSGMFRHRPVVVQKLQPDLWIESTFNEPVYSGDEAHFLLTYGNAGGLESQAWVTSTFPAEAPFVASDPPPTAVAPDGRWARWDVGSLPMGEQQVIHVIVEIAPGLPPSATIEIWNGIFDHVRELRDDAVIFYHVPPPTWDKWVNGEPWTPETVVAAQTFDTFSVTDIISSRSALALVERWNPARLSLSEFITQSTEPGLIVSGPDFIAWRFPDGAPGAVTLTKIYHTEPCTWTYSVLWEELWVEQIEWERRPVLIEKLPPDLWLDSAYQPQIFPGRDATFLLNYGNLGGLESQVWITGTFPAEAPFAGADPPPVDADPQGRWALWETAPLAQGEERSITVTVAITHSLPSNAVLPIYAYLNDHVGIERDWTSIIFERAPGVYLPLIWRDSG